MRAKLLRKQLITVRRLKEKPGDVFGDAPIITSDNREDGFPIKAQLNWTSRVLFSDGNPGKDEQRVAFLMILKSDRHYTAPDWIPNTNDLFELAEGDKLFVKSVEPAFPRRISLGSPTGGFDGWRVNVKDSSPSIGASIQYES